MGRYSTDDFGYDFPSKTEETVSLVNPTPTTEDENNTSAPEILTQAQSSEGGVGYELYEDNQRRQQHRDEEPYVYRPAKINRGGENFFVASGEAAGGAAINPVECIGAFCCCIAITFVIVGGILLAYVRYKDEAAELLIGSFLLVIAAGTCLFGCCALCIGTSADGLLDANTSSGQSKADPNFNEVKVRFRRLNDRYEKGCMTAENGLQNVRLDVVGHMKEVKEALKKEVKEKKERETKTREELEKRVKEDLKSGLSVKEIRQQYRPVVFYIVFDGDLLVSDLELFRKQIALVVNLAKPGRDQCVVAITSPGGAVSQYGLAASQLVRIRKAGIHLTCCVDTVAASGGYMMASVANKICAAPFAVVGSIGVVTQIPNFQRFLNEHKIDAYLCTAGDYKRTIDIIGDVTEEGKAKMTEQLDDIHIAFKDHVALARPRLKDSIEEVGTGEHWLAIQAKEKGLVDEIMTSDEYLESLCEDFDIIEILEKIQKPKGVAGLFGNHFEAAGRSVKSILDRFQSTVDPQGVGPTPMAIV
jgi:serine protease SohB